MARREFQPHARATDCLLRRCACFDIPRGLGQSDDWPCLGVRGRKSGAQPNPGHEQHYHEAIPGVCAIQSDPSWYDSQGSGGVLLSRCLFVIVGLYFAVCCRLEFGIWRISRLCFCYPMIHLGAETYCISSPPAEEMRLISTALEILHIVGIIPLSKHNPAHINAAQCIVYTLTHLTPPPLPFFKPYTALSNETDSKYPSHCHSSS